MNLPKNGSDKTIVEFGQAVQVLSKTELSARQNDILQAKTALYAYIPTYCGNHSINEILTNLHSRINPLRAMSLMNPRHMPFKSCGDCRDLPGLAATGGNVACG